MEAYSNVCLEGTNNKLKHSENGVRPQDSKAKSTRVMVFQDEEEGCKLKKASIEGLFKTPTYSNTITCKSIIKTAESELQQQLAQTGNYVSLRKDETNWLVVRSTLRCRTLLKTRPVFSRVRHLGVDENNEFGCSCYFFERFGIPCRHMAHVAKAYGCNFVGFTARDVDVRYHRSYSHYVAANDANELNEIGKQIRNKLIKLRDGRFVAPKAPSFKAYENCVKFSVGTESEEQSLLFDLPHVMAHFEDRGINTVVLNYCTEDVETAKKAAETFGNCAGMTQVMYNGEEGVNEADTATVFPDNDKEEDIEFPMDNQENAENDRPVPFHERFNPMFKEMCLACEHASETEMKEIEITFQNIISDHMKKRAAMLPAANGKIVSCLPVDRNASYKHHKQRPYGYGG